MEIDRDAYELLPTAKKRALADKYYTIVCEEMDEEAKDCDQYYCKGCGEGKSKLDHHHIWAKGMGGALPLWYYFQKENLILLCRTCHRKIDGSYEEKRGLFCYLYCEEQKQKLIQENNDYKAQVR